MNIPESKPASSVAFTLLEVIIACALFFMFAFAVLELVTRGLSAARSIQHREPDPALVLAPLAFTNRLEIGVQSGDFEDLYPGIYPGYQWSYEVSQPFGETNPLCQVTAVVTGTTGKRRTSESSMTVLMYSPGTVSGGAFGGRPLGR